MLANTQLAVPVSGEQLWPDCALPAGEFAVRCATQLAAAAGVRSVHTSDVLERCTAVEQAALIQGIEAFSPWSGFFSARDGHVRTHGNYPHHQRVLREVTGARTPADFAAAIAGETARDVEAAITSAGGVAVAVRSHAGWARTGQGREVADAPLVHMARRDTERRALPPERDGLLAGVRVVDFTRVVAGPAATAILAAHGADVLRVDHPHLPEEPLLVRVFGERKRSVTWNLDDLADRSLLDTELATADVVIDGYRPGALARYGLDAATLAADHPGLITASISAWGEHGPWATRRGFDSVVQAATGIAHALADAEGHPGKLPAQLLDHGAGMLLAANVIRSVTAPEPTACHIEVSLARMAHELLG